MSVSVIIFAFLLDVNDEVKLTTTTTSGSQVQKQKAAPTTQPQKKVETAKVATEGKVKAPAKTENKPPKESPSEGSATAPFKSNKPPRQQQHDKRDHAQKEESKEEPRQPAHRQFDRKSGTGRGKEVKRSGGGKSNWGTQDDDRKASEEPIDSETKEETPVKTEAIVAESTVTTTDAKPEQKEEGKDEEEEDNTKTLEEFLGSVKKPSFQLPPPRQIDESLGAKGTAHRKEREEEPMKKEKKEEKKEEKKKMTRNLYLLIKSSNSMTPQNLLDEAEEIKEEILPHVVEEDLVENEVEVEFKEVLHQTSRMSHLFLHYQQQLQKPKKKTPNPKTLTLFFKDNV